MACPSDTRKGPWGTKCQSGAYFHLLALFYNTFFMVRYISSCPVFHLKGLTLAEKRKDPQGTTCKFEVYFYLLSLWYIVCGSTYFKLSYFATQGVAFDQNNVR